MRPTSSTTAAATAAYVALAAVDTALAGSRSATRRRLRLITKPLLMPALGTAFASALADLPADDTARPRGGVLRGGTVAAQALSGVGDIALLGKSEPAFLGGLSSFFGAHVAYTAAFGSAGRRLDDASHLEGVGAAAGFATLVGPAVAWAAGRRSPKLRRPVAAYATIISTMFAASTRLDPSIPEDARRTIVAGTGLFVLSDSVIAARKFLLRNPTPTSDAVVMATYTAGQGLIAAGVVRAVRSRADQAPKHRAAGH